MVYNTFYIDQKFSSHSRKTIGLVNKFYDLILEPITAVLTYTTCGKFFNLVF